MKTYDVNEIFYSLQGEGAFTGTPMVFVRFGRCNRRCPFCDTDFEKTQPMTLDNIVENVCRYPASTVVLTGGEPLLQADRSLVDAIRQAGRRIHVETNGSLTPPPGVDWVTCSPKDRFPAIKPECVNEVKIVYTGQSEKELQRYYDMFSPYTSLFFLQPCSGLNIDRTVRFILKNPLWRLSLQTHKLINIP